MLFILEDFCFYRICWGISARYYGIFQHNIRQLFAILIHRLEIMLLMLMVSKSKSKMLFPSFTSSLLWTIWPLLVLNAVRPGRRIFSVPGFRCFFKFLNNLLRGPALIKLSRMSKWLQYYIGISHEDDCQNAGSAMSMKSSGGNLLQNQLPSECDYLLRVLKFMAIILL